MRSQRVITLLLVLTFVSFMVYANEDGKSGRTQKSGKGCTCHGKEADESVKVSLTGAGTLKPGATAEYTVTITGGPLKAGGTNIAASDGTLKPGKGMKDDGGELVHSAPKPADKGKVTFTFSYTAPSTEGKVTLYASGNSANLDETKKNDAWNFAPSLEITVKK